MILVELYFQELNQEYDVNLDEKLPVSSVIDSLVELIAQKEHMTLAKNTGLFLLCDSEKQQLLHPQTTLAENGIRSGHRLLLL